ncbi:unnamed protein product [Anisakis simplex]|uniref:Uncharacterized protein n=1 Tax=Anisakis simplex TaxID=6269 RepID=A0A0M3JK28_ANISI|nr:unnamed protein product [Anisakis simplex]
MGEAGSKGAVLELSQLLFKVGQMFSWFGHFRMMSSDSDGYGFWIVPS